jgi:hypothetical protein
MSIYQKDEVFTAQYGAWEIEAKRERGGERLHSEIEIEARKRQ